MSNIQELRNRKLARDLNAIQEKIEVAIGDNFGYEPDYPWFIALLEKSQEMSKQLKSVDDNAYALYMNKYIYN